jgi:hypothetical protein
VDDISSLCSLNAPPTQTPVSTGINTTRPRTDRASSKTQAEPRSPTAPSTPTPVETDTSTRPRTDRALNSMEQSTNTTSDTAASIQNQLNCYYTNATSLRNKLASLNAMASSLRPHIIAITETWFTDSCCTNITGYNTFNKNRRGHGGGVVIYVDSDIDSFEVSNSTLSNDSVEQIWCGIRVGSDKILLGCIYRPPPKPSELPASKQLREKSIQQSIATAASLVKKGDFSGMCICGDFNYNKTAWDFDSVPLCTGGLSLPDHKFIETLNDNFIHQAVTFPTFVNASGNCVNYLDLVLTESNDRVFNVEAGPPLSDDSNQFHVSINWHLAVASSRSGPVFERSSFNYNKGDYEKLTRELNVIDWDTLFADKNTNECYELFTNEYDRLVSLCIPKQSSLARKIQPPWMTRTLNHLIATKKRLWILVQQTRSRVKSILDEYKQVRREVKKATKRSVIDYEKSIVYDKKNNKRLYGYVKSKQKTPKSISAMKRLDDTVSDSGLEISNILNTYFKSVFVNEDKSAPLPDFEQRTSACISSATLCVNDISKRISQLDHHKAPGVDGIHPRVLKACHSAMAVPLAKIFYSSLHESRIPDKWRVANVTPLHKKGSRLDPANYRPVSLTSIPCKILERVVRDAIMDHLYAHKLISPQQHGFVRNKACVTNLLETIDELTSSLALKSWVDVIFLDFAKAFDKVPHRRLVQKLEAYGIRGELLAWIADFLTNRQQRVVMGSNVSEWEAITSGVPQGSVLGPLLFIVFINDMPEVVKNFKCKLYADDSKIIARIKNESDSCKLQQDLDAIVKWTETWLMQLNLDKCKVMHVGYKNPAFNYTMAQHTLTTTEAERDLGVTITSDIKWHVHANNITSKANSILGWMRSAFMCRDENLWKKLYTTYIRPHLEFAAPAWNVYNRQDIDRIERVQQRATKVSHNLKQHSYPDRLKVLELTTLETRRTRGDCIQAYKIQTDRDIVDWHVQPLVSDHALGHRPRLRREIVSSCQQRHHFFTNRIVNNWNSLPVSATSATDVNGFKKAYDTFTKNG